MLLHVQHSAFCSTCDHHRKDTCARMHRRIECNNIPNHTSSLASCGSCIGNALCRMVSQVPFRKPPARKHCSTQLSVIRNSNTMMLIIQHDVRTPLDCLRSETVPVFYTRPRRSCIWRSSWLTSPLPTFRKDMHKMRHLLCTIDQRS